MIIKLKMLDKYAYKTCSNPQKKMTGSNFFKHFQEK